ncbi:MAG: peptidylprolyl isomerase [Deltaproteobacteria bacterium]|nr:peptidylprolyl isomerase [Deltaproteobacteria bacterium]
MRSCFRWGMRLLIALAMGVGFSACRKDEEPSFHPAPSSSRGNESSHASETSSKLSTLEHASMPSGHDSPASVLLDPARASLRAPEHFTVVLETTKGEIRMEVHRAWAPHGADRFYSLVKAGYYTDVAFFRVISGFMAQTGIHGDPKVNAAWRHATIPDDPVLQSNKRGMVSFATAGPNSRTTQFFINFVDNSRLDQMGFAPFAQVAPESMAVVDRLYAGYGEGAPNGKGPSQARIQREGNAYLRAEFPLLDYIRSARIIEEK